MSFVLQPNCVRFATDEVGLPPPYPGPHNGLDLSCVNGLDLTSPHYEGLNLSQQCLNLSNSNNSNIARPSQNSNNSSTVSQPGNNVQIHSSNKQTPQYQHQNQNQSQQQQQSEMVLNLSTQMGLNLSRNAVGSGSYNPMYNSFEYYNTGYYDNSYNNTSAASALCQMEEQRCSPLNLEHRSSPLNLTSVGNIQRKRKPTPGQAVPLNMGSKVDPILQQSQDNMSLPQQQQQDFSCDNHAYDYRIPNKLTAFYNQQQPNLSDQKLKSDNKVMKVQLQSTGSSYQQGQVYNQKPVILTQIKNNTNQEKTAGEENAQSNIMLNNSTQLLGSSYYQNTNFQQEQNSNDVISNLTSTPNKKIPNSKPSSSEKLLSQSPSKVSNLSHLPDSLMPFDTSNSDDFLFQDDYEDLNYSYSDALNFAAEAMSDASPSKMFEGSQTKEKIPGNETANDLSTQKNFQLHNCQHCSAQFSSSSDLQVHVEKHHKSNSSNFSCSLCKINFYEESQLLTHNKICHENIKSKGTVKLSLQKEDKQPMNMTLGKLSPPQCPGKQNIHKIEKKFSKNKTKAEIDQLREISAKEPLPFQCITCAVKFAERSALLLHLEEHNEVKPFKCEICNLGFTHMSAKKRHEKAHSNEKPHQCQECPRAFFRRSDLTHHKKTHSRERFKFSCADCGQVFKSEKKLKDHKCSAKSPPGKQLQCSLCECILTSKMSWGVHMWKHTKDSAYILTSETDPWPSSLLDKLPKDLTKLSPWSSSSIDSIQPLNMQAVPS